MSKDIMKKRIVQLIIFVVIYGILLYMEATLFVSGTTAGVASSLLVEFLKYFHFFPDSSQRGRLSEFAGQTVFAIVMIVVSILITGFLMKKNSSVSDAYNAEDVSVTEYEVDDSGESEGIISNRKEGVSDEQKELDKEEKKEEILQSGQDISETGNNNEYENGQMADNEKKELAEETVENRETESGEREKKNSSTDSATYYVRTEDNQNKYIKETDSQVEHIAEKLDDLAEKISAVLSQKTENSIPPTVVGDREPFKDTENTESVEEENTESVEEENAESVEKGETQPAEPEVMQPSDSENVQASVSEQKKPDTPEDTQPSDSEEEKPDTPEDTQPSDSEEGKPDTPEDTQPSDSEEEKPDTPEDTQPSDSEEGKPDTPEDTQPSDSEEEKPDTPEDTQPSDSEEEKPNTPEAVQPSDSEEMPPAGSGEDVSPADPEPDGDTEAPVKRNDYEVLPIERKEGRSVRVTGQKEVLESEMDGIIDISGLTRISDRIRYAGDERWYYFCPPVSGVYSFVLYGEKDCSEYEITFVKDEQNSESNGFLYEVVSENVVSFDMAESYWIHIGQSLGFGAYTFEIGYPKNPEDISEFTNYQDRMQFEGQEITYFMVPEQTGCYRFDLTGLAENEDVDITVCRQDTGESDTGNKTGLTVKSMQEGEMYKIIISQLEGLCSYELQIGRQKETVDLTGHTGAKDSIQYKDQCNCYQLMIEETGSYYFWIQDMDEDLTVDLLVMNEIGQPVGESCYTDEGSEGICVDAEEGECLTILVQGKESTGEYFLDYTKRRSSD